MLIRQASIYKHDFFFTHNSMLFIFLTITHKMAQISYPYKHGTYWSLHGSSLNYCDTKTHHKTRRHQCRDQNQISTQSEIAWNQSQKFAIFIPKILSGLSENSPENSSWTVQKQSRKLLKIPILSPKNLGLKFTTSHAFEKTLSH